MQKTKSGFTLVEVLIVIVVIAILAAVTIVSYNGAQMKAQAAATLSGFKSIRQAMLMMNADNGRTTWPPQTDYPDPDTDGYPPRISWIIANTGFGSYMNAVPVSPGADANWAYVNDGSPGDDVSNCSGRWHGPLLTVKARTVRLAELVDEQADDGNPDCGKIRLEGRDLIYRLSSTQEL